MGIKAANYTCTQDKCKLNGKDQEHFYATGAESSVVCCLCEYPIKKNEIQPVGYRRDHFYD